MATEPQNITIGSVDVKQRTDHGKSSARRLRATGQIPAVLYGEHKDALPLSVDPLLLVKALDPQKRRNTVFDLRITTADGQVQLQKAMLKEAQVDPLKQTLVHADFVRVSLDRPIRVAVPLVLEGKPEGVKVGGVLHQVFRTIEVECTPDVIPATIVADVSGLGMGGTLAASQLPVGPKVKVCLPPAQTCAIVSAPRKEVEVTATAEGEAAAAAPAEAGKEGETKAAAAAAPAKAPAAPAKADKKDKK